MRMFIVYRMKNELLRPWSLIDPVSWIVSLTSRCELGWKLVLANNQREFPQEKKRFEEEIEEEKLLAPVSNLRVRNK